MKFNLPIIFLVWGICLLQLGIPSSINAQSQKTLKPVGPKVQHKKIDLENLKLKEAARQILLNARNNNPNNNNGQSLNLDQLRTVDARNFFKQRNTGAKAFTIQKYSITKGENGLPIFMKLNSPVRLQENQNGKAESIIYQFLEDQKETLKIGYPKEEFKIRSQEEDKLGMTHIRMDQHFEGIPVWGADITLHLKNGIVTSFNGRYQASSDQSVHPLNISKTKALELARADIDQHTKVISWPAKLLALMDEPLESSMLTWLPNKEGELNLTWKVEFHANLTEHWVYFVEATSGQILKKMNTTCSGNPATARARDLSGVTRTINTYQEGGTYWLLDATKDMWRENESEVPQETVGGIITLDAQGGTADDNMIVYANSTNNQWNSPELVSAHYNGVVAHDYFKNVHNRNSLDGQGGTIFSIANYDIKDNAFWSKPFIVYGKGDQVFNGPLAEALDVAGHELAHGVTENSAGLIYEFQSGALNESFSDVFGVMIDRDDWQLAEDVAKSTHFPSGAMRDMADPNNGWNSSQGLGRGWQPKHMNEFLNLERDQDNGGVHINSGIPNHAFYRFVLKVGKEIAEQVYYRALTVYLNRSSQFIDCRIAVVQSAQDLYDNNVVTAAGEAFDEVGIFGTGNDGGNNDDDDDVVLPDIEGNQFILTTTQDQSSNNIIANYSFADESYFIFSNFEPKPKPSIDETGNAGVFVNTADKGVYILDLNNSDPNSNATFSLGEDDWSKVIINRDASKLALLRERDNNIVFYDADTETFREFELFNPNTSQGGEVSRPDYADVIEFDPTGQFIVYDAFNSLNSTTGFWDIGIINVWNNSTNSIGSGNIFKVFSNLRDGISVGNPTFSKTNPNIIAFELINEDEELTTIYTYNLQSQELKEVWINNFYSDFSLLGFPSFAPDDGAIAFTAENGDSDKIIAIRNLAEDKITPSGDASGLVFGEFPVWYAKGGRQFQRPNADFFANVTEGEAPLTVSFFDDSQNVPLTWEWSFPGGEPSSSSLEEPTVKYSQPGTYTVTLKVTNDAGESVETKSQYIAVTEQSCSALKASDIIVEDVGYSHFFLRWLDVSDTYTVRYREVGTQDWVLLENWQGSTHISSIKKPCTTYEWQIQDACNSGANSFLSKQITTQGCDDPYCYSYGIAFENWIQRINVNGESFTSGKDYGYELYGNTNLSFEAGDNYPIELIPGTSEESSVPLFWSMAIDANNDGDFTDIGEFILRENGTNQANVSTSFRIPSNAVTGNLRMRLIMETENNADPCKEGGLREVEDYIVAVKGATTNINDFELLSALNIYPNPTSGRLMVNLNLNTKETLDLTLYNVLGEMVHQHITEPFTGAQNIQLDLNHLTSGHYRLAIRTDSGKLLGSMPVNLVK